MAHALLQDGIRLFESDDESSSPLIAGFLEGTRLKSYCKRMQIGTFSRSLLSALLLTGAVSVAEPLETSKEQADRLERKIEEIDKNATADPVRSKKTPMSELEINSYLNFNLKEKIPSGLTNPQISLSGNGNVGGRVFVDIDQFKRHRGSGGIIDPLNYLSGRVPLTARGVLRTTAGQGQFRLISAEIHRVPVPKPLLQELVSFFSRTQGNPRGMNIDEPFNLPAKIREVIVNPREAIVVQ
jgi:hypothetical protein